MSVLLAAPVLNQITTGLDGVTPVAPLTATGGWQGFGASGSSTWEGGFGSNSTYPVTYGPAQGSGGGFVSTAASVAQSNAAQAATAAQDAAPLGFSAYIVPVLIGIAAIIGLAVGLLNMTGVLSTDVTVNEPAKAAA